ncbi:hypothetical protein TanjilG_30576 [Lupinus angustifolius]|uniref:Uncharacterized protein n=1 Tax=Lupinus angustifolius TaxID=3871 RepID=A0A394CUR8_LUPAN|nr:hypothetical protein TanjilG_30573 [Lupinus angustifolius]OIW14857.1 hypothetical protein TanjilG_30576 [Lupinus angustifolius]
MSMPMYQQPPLVTVSQQHSSYDRASEHDSIGPLIGVLIVVILLGIIAVMIGRLCSGRRIMGYGQYDIESWAESKCSTCIDGRINLSSPPIRTTEPTTISLPATPTQETKQAEPSSHNQTPN